MDQVMSIDGFWTAEFASTEGSFGGGVAFMQNGRIFGGDSGYSFVGTYELDKGDEPSAMKAHLLVEPFIKDFPSIFRTTDVAYSIELLGSLTADVIIAQGFITDFPDLRLSAKLTRKVRL
jgi:T3SS negative regulator,GrlR